MSGLRHGQTITTSTSARLGIVCGQADDIGVRSNMEDRTVAKMHIRASAANEVAESFREQWDAATAAAFFQQQGNLAITGNMGWLHGEHDRVQTNFLAGLRCSH